MKGIPVICKACGKTIILSKDGSKWNLYRHYNEACTEGPMNVLLPNALAYRCECSEEFPTRGGYYKHIYEMLNHKKERITSQRIIKQRIIRPSWDRYFLDMAKQVASRSTCRRHQVGAVIVKGKHLIATGYNGAPAGLADCLELGCLREEQGISSGEHTEICRAIHAEPNAIIQAAIHGTSIEGGIMYCTHSPCILCAKMIINAHIKKFICSNYYADREFIKLFEDAGIEFRGGIK